MKTFWLGGKHETASKRRRANETNREDAQESEAQREASRERRPSPFQIQTARRDEESESCFVDGVGGARCAYGGHKRANSSAEQGCRRARRNYRFRLEAAMKALFLFVVIVSLLAATIFERWFCEEAEAPMDNIYIQIHKGAR